MTSGGWERRWLGASAATRARHPASTFGATSSNRSPGKPTARIALSLNASCAIVFTLTLPGSSRTAANTSAAPNSAPSSPVPAPSPPSGSAARVIRARIRAAASAGTRLAIRMVSACSACRRAVPMTRRTRSRAGGSTCSRFRYASSSSRTRSACRPLSHTFAASHSAALSASATEHSRNPKYLRMSACRNHPAQKQRLASRSGNGRWSAARARPGDDALLLVEAEGELVRGHAHELAERGSHRITLIPGDVVALGPRRPSRSPSATM